MIIHKGEQYEKIIPEDDPVYEETQIAWDRADMELRRSKCAKESRTRKTAVTDLHLTFSAVLIAKKQ